MRFMIMVKATALSESGAMPEESLMAAMGAYHEELAKAGVCGSFTHNEKEPWQCDS